jgi:zinc transport system substrate-binding protein
LRLLSAVSLLFATISTSFYAQAQVQVLTSIKPLQLIAAAVQDDLGQPEVLLPPGASPHHYALRPSDVQRVRKADLLYWIGPDMEAFLPRVLEGRQGANVAVQDLPGLSLRHFGEQAGEHAEDDHDEHHHAEENHDHHDELADKHDHNHRPGSLDAHLWLMSANAKVIADKIAADLAKADPANAGRYQANAEAFSKRLDALDQRIKSQVQSVKGKPYFVFHEAYDYFESAYGLKHAGVFSVLTDVQPGAQHVAAMRERLEKTGPACIFSEPPLRPRLAQTLSAGLPVKLAELDALGGALPVSSTGYEALLGNLASELTGCLKGL